MRIYINSSTIFCKNNQRALKGISGICINTNRRLCRQPSVVHKHKNSNLSQDFSYPHSLRYAILDDSYSSISISSQSLYIIHSISKIITCIFQHIYNLRPQNIRQDLRKQTWKFLQAELLECLAVGLRVSLIK